MPRGKFISRSEILDLLSAINPDSYISVYIQLENLIRFGIASGTLIPNDQLPPARDLAERLGINMNTVSKAYRDLVVMGLLTTKRGLGVFIKDDVIEQCKEVSRKTVMRHFFEATAEAKIAGFKAEDLKGIVDRIYANNVYPYGPIPESIIPNV